MFRKFCNIGEELNFPSGIISGYYLEIYSGKETVITGDFIMEELGETVLRIKTKENKIAFCGKNIKIDYYTDSGIRISGKLDSIEFD